MAEESEVSSYKIEVHVSQGRVTLSGTVSDDMERLRAEEDVRGVPGVKEVVNQIRVSPEAGR